MRRELIATIAGRERTVIVETVADQDRWRVVIDGVEHMVDAHEVRPNTWSLSIDGRMHLVDLDARKSGTTALVGGFELGVEIEDARRKRLAEAVAARGGHVSRGEVLEAPIAGKVVKVLVEVGAEVAAGQSVAVLEAMKMENEILAERGGVVEVIHVSAGQPVDTGDKLVTLG
ncbi:MAG TPA: biotin/lipoyl-containing protein [Kofleriaceae bacterium]|nr:biotin/lipoyl-containing protein [Kofleriaceae bacterium]